MDNKQAKKLLRSKNIKKCFIFVSLVEDYVQISKQEALRVISPNSKLEYSIENSYSLYIDYIY